MKPKHFSIILIIILILCFLWHYKQHSRIETLEAQNDSLQAQSDSLILALGGICPAPCTITSTCDKIPLGTASTAYSLYACSAGVYTYYDGFPGINGGSILTTNIMTDYNKNPTLLNCLSFSYVFTPNTIPANSTMYVKFHLNNYSAGKINRQTGADYYSNWLCPTYCPPSSVPSPGTYSGTSAPLFLSTNIGGARKWYNTFCGSNGGTLSDVILKDIKSNPSANCITYTFVFVPDASCGNSRLSLRFHLNHYDSATNTISVLTGSDYAADMLCPTICPM